MWAVTSLWPEKVVFGSQIYSARAKLKLIVSDQARDSSTSGILNKSIVSAKVTCDDLCGESESY